MQLEEKRPSENELTPLEEIKQLVVKDEEMGYDAPFATITWKGWLEMQAHILQNMARFQRAIANEQMDSALFAALEVQEIATQLLKEASASIGRNPAALKRLHCICGYRK